MSKKKFTKLGDRVDGNSDESTKERKSRPKTENTANLNFKISPDNKLKFRKLALDKGMKLNEFLVYLMDEYQKK